MDKKDIERYVEDLTGFCHITCLLYTPPTPLGETPMQRSMIRELQQLCETVYELQEQLGEDLIALECSTGLVEEYRDDWNNANRMVVWNVLVHRDVLSYVHNTLMLRLPFIRRYNPTPGKEDAQ